MEDGCLDLMKGTEDEEGRGFKESIFTFFFGFGAGGKEGSAEDLKFQGEAALAVAQITLPSR